MVTIRINILLVCFVFCLILIQNCNSRSSGTGEVLIQKSVDTVFTDFPGSERKPLYRSRDGGQSWEDISVGLPSEIQASFLDRLGTSLVLATEHNYLFIKDTRQDRWRQIGTDLPNPKINALYIFQNYIYVSVFQEGIFRSDDRGKTWINLNYNLPDLNVQAIVKPINDLIIGTDSGIFKFDPQQIGWKKVFEGEQVVSLQNEGRQVIAGSTAGVLRSLDNGESWQLIHEGGAIHNTAYLKGHVLAMYISNEVFVSPDAGSYWQRASYSPLAGSYVYEASLIQNQLLMSNNYGVHRSQDGGLHWQLVFETEDYIFFDFFVDGEIIYGVTRSLS